MAVEMRITPRLEAMQKDLRRVSGEIVPKTIAPVLNRTAAKIVTATVKETAKRTNIKQKIIRKRIRVKKAFAQKRKGGGTKSRLNAQVRFLLAPVPARILGNIRQTRKGGSVGKHKFPGAFIAIGAQRHRALFRREGRARHPIDEMRVPVEKEGVAALSNHVATTGPRFFVPELERVLAISLAKKGLVVQQPKRAGG